MDVHIKPKDCPEIAENYEKKGVLKVQGRLEQSYGVPFEGEHDQRRAAVKVVRFSTVHWDKMEMKLIRE